MAATRKFMPHSAVIAALALLVAVASLICAVLHQGLISEHMEMMVALGVSFQLMTLLSYLAALGALIAGLVLINGNSSKRLVAVARFGLKVIVVGMVIMIALYFYVHDTSLPLPLQIEHEGNEPIGWASVATEAAAVAFAWALLRLTRASKPSIIRSSQPRITTAV